MTPRPLTLEEALALTPYKNVKTLRRAYEAGELTVFQPVPGAIITVDPDELSHWLRRRREATPTARVRDRIARRVADAVAHRSPEGRAEPARAAELRGAPPRVSLAELMAT